MSGAFSAEDSHGDRVYNTGTSAWLETGEAPLQPPAPPAGVTAMLSATSIFESFTGASSCGVRSRTGKVKPVKSGTFATSPVEISG